MLCFIGSIRKIRITKRCSMHHFLEIYPNFSGYGNSFGYGPQQQLGYGFNSMYNPYQFQQYPQAYQGYNQMGGGIIDPDLFFYFFICSLSLWSTRISKPHDGWYSTGWQEEMKINWFVLFLIFSIVLLYLNKTTLQFFRLENDGIWQVEVGLLISYYLLSERNRKTTTTLSLEKSSEKLDKVVKYS